jgi:hypothetical protein
VRVGSNNAEGITVRAASNWDLLGLFHYIVVLVFFGLLIFQIIRLKRAKKKIAIFVQTILIVVTLFIGLVLRQVSFPEGSLHHPVYRFQRISMAQVQARLTMYHEECGHYPTTVQGIDMLTHKDCIDRCKESFKGQTKYTDIKYLSDGKTYEMESIRDLGFTGLLVRATNAEEARLYIRE